MTRETLLLEKSEAIKHKIEMEKQHSCCKQISGMSACERKNIVQESSIKIPTHKLPWRYAP